MIGRVLSQGNVQQQQRGQEVREANTSVTDARITKIAKKRFENFNRNHSQTTWNRIRLWWKGTHFLDQEMKELDQALEKGETKSDAFQGCLMMVIDQLSRHRGERSYTKASLQCKNFLKKFSEEDIAGLNDFLEKAAREKVRGKRGIGDQKVLLDACLKLLSLEAIKNLVAFKHKEVAGIQERLDNLQQIAKDAVRFTQNPENRVEKSKKHFVKAFAAAVDWLGRFFKMVLNVTVGSYSISVDDPPPQEQWQAEMRLRAVKDLFFYYPKETLLFFVGLLEEKVTKVMAWTLSTTFMTTAVLGVRLLHKKLGSKTDSLSFGYDNLNRSVVEHPREPVVGREEEVNEIRDCLGDMDRNSLSPLLLGDPGVGKNEIIRRLTEGIVKGEYPKLKGKTVFHVNCAKLLQIGGHGMSGYQSRLERLLEDIKGKEDNTILFFDEIAALFKSEGRAIGSVQDELKSAIENGRVHCIAATTNEEFQKYVKEDKAFCRRFKKINVEPLPEETCKTALRNIAREATDVKVSEEAFDVILRIAKEEIPTQEEGQIAYSTNLLRRAIGAIKILECKEKTQDLPKAKRAFEQAQKRVVETPSLLPFSVEGSTIIEETMALERAKKDIQQKIEEKEQHIARLVALRQQGNQIRRRSESLTRDFSKVDEKKESERFNALAKGMLFVSEYLQQAAHTVIAEQEQVLQEGGIPIRIDEAFILSLREKERQEA